MTVLRYVIKGTIKERFIEFTEAKEKTANALTDIILSTVAPYNGMKDKLISQTYNGAAMKGHVNGVQTQVKKEYPNAHFIHCYAHELTQWANFIVEIFLRFSTLFLTTIEISTSV